MTLQQRIKASAQELIRLLEESDSEYQDFLKDRDARLGAADQDEEPIKDELKRLRKLTSHFKKQIQQQPGYPAARRIESRRAERIHSASINASELIDTICEKLRSELFATVESKGIQGLIKYLNSKVILDVKVFRSGNHFKCEIDHVKETDRLLHGIGDDLIFGILGIE